MPERYRIITFEGAFFTAARSRRRRRRQKKYLEGFGPVVEGFDQVPFADLEATKRAIGRRRHPDRADHGRGACGWCRRNSCARCASCATQRPPPAFDEVQTGVRRSGQLFAYQQSGGARHHGAGEGLAAAFPAPCLATAEAAKGMVAGTHGSTFGGNPLAMAAAGALLDVVLADGFLERVRHTALILKQKLAEIRDRHPAVIAEVRGEGLLVGLRAVVPSSQLVDELRAEKMITVAAGDNVVRLLPPLIVSEDEVAEAVRRIDRACARIASALQAPQRQGAAG